MSLNVIIDETDELTGHEARLASILEFVADTTERGVMYVYEEWAIQTLFSNSTSDFKPHIPRLAYLSKREYIENGSSWKTSAGRLNTHVPTTELIYSRSDIIRKGALEQQGLNATTALLLLAACGIDIALPNVSFERKCMQEISAIRDKLLDERIQYIEAITKLSDESFSRLSSGDYVDIIRWARNESIFKILPKALLLQRKLEKLDKSLLQRAGVMFWNEGVPAIGKALCEEGGRAAAKVLAEESIKILSVTLSKCIEERRIPEAGYILKLSSELSKYDS